MFHDPLSKAISSDDAKEVIAILKEHVKLVEKEFKLDKRVYRDVIYYLALLKDVKIFSKRLRLARRGHPDYHEAMALDGLKNRLEDASKEFWAPMPPNPELWIQDNNRTNLETIGISQST